MSIMEVVKKVNKKYYLFIIYLNFSFIMLSTRMDNHRQTIRKEFPAKEYQVIRDEVKTIKVINGKNEGVKILPDQSNPKNNQDNGNHAEKKLMSHITQQNQNGSINDVKINIQNTSKESPGACFGCGGKDGTGGTIQDFKNLNKDLKIHIEHDSTKTSP